MCRSSFIVDILYAADEIGIRKAVTMYVCYIYCTGKF